MKLATLPLAGIIAFSMLPNRKGVEIASKGSEVTMVATHTADKVGEIIASALEIKDAKAIQTLIDNTPEGETVTVGEGIWMVTGEGITLKNGQTLIGQGTKKTIFKLGPNVNRSVLDMRNTNDIAIKDMCVDGSRAEQDGEFSTKPNNPIGWDPNNCITIMRCQRVILSNLEVHSGSSAGIGFALGSRDAYVVNVEAHDNGFDGISFGNTERVLVQRSRFYNNLAAGVTGDCENSDCTFEDCIIENNLDTGLFVRSTNGLRFFRGKIGGGRNGSIQVSPHHGMGARGEAKNIHFRDVEIRSEVYVLGDSDVTFSPPRVILSSLPPPIVEPPKLISSTEGSQ